MFQGIFEHRYAQGGEMEADANPRTPAFVRDWRGKMRASQEQSRKTRAKYRQERRDKRKSENDDEDEVSPETRELEAQAQEHRAKLEAEIRKVREEQPRAYADSIRNSRQKQKEENVEPSELEYNSDWTGTYNDEKLPDWRRYSTPSDLEYDSHEATDTDNGITDVGEPSVVDEADARKNDTSAQSAPKGSSQGGGFRDASLDDLVRRTIRGEFGNGAERKKALGNRYSEVQRAINQKYSSKSGSPGSERGDKAKAAIDSTDAEKLRTSGIPSRIEPSSDIFQDIPSRMGGESSQSQQGGDYFNNMSDEDLSSLVEHLTALLRSRQQGGRPGDTDEMDEILAKTEGRGGY